MMCSKEILVSGSWARRVFVHCRGGVDGVQELGKARCSSLFLILDSTSRHFTRLTRVSLSLHFLSLEYTVLDPSYPCLFVLHNRSLPFLLPAFLLLSLVCVSLSVSARSVARRWGFGSAAEWGGEGNGGWS